MIDCRRSCSIASRSGRPGASSASWPTNSSSVRGRMRSASGAARIERRMLRLRLPGRRTSDISGALPLARRLRNRISAAATATLSDSTGALHRNRERVVGRARRSPSAARHLRRRARRRSDREDRQRSAACRRAGRSRSTAIPSRRALASDRRRPAGARRSAAGACCPSRRAAPSSRTDRRCRRSRRRRSRRTPRRRGRSRRRCRDPARRSSTSTSGGLTGRDASCAASRGRAAAIATTPDGCCTGLIAASTWSATRDHAGAAPLRRFVHQRAAASAVGAAIGNRDDARRARPTAALRCSRCAPSSSTAPLGVRRARELAEARARADSGGS